jgi:hypothetical protein
VFACDKSLDLFVSNDYGNTFIIQTAGGVGVISNAAICCSSTGSKFAYCYTTPGGIVDITYATNYGYGFQYYGNANQAAYSSQGLIFGIIGSGTYTTNTLSPAVIANSSTVASISCTSDGATFYLLTNTGGGSPNQIKYTTSTAVNPWTWASFSNSGSGLYPWTSIANSSNGSKIVACSTRECNIYTSPLVAPIVVNFDTGTPTTIANVVCTTDGTYAYFATSKGIYRVTLADQTTVSGLGPNNNSWSTLCCSYDGTYLGACDTGTALIYAGSNITAKFAVNSIDIGVNNALTGVNTNSEPTNYATYNPDYNFNQSFLSLPFTPSTKYLQTLYKITGTDIGTLCCPCYQTITETNVGVINGNIDANCKNLVVVLIGGGGGGGGGGSTSGGTGGSGGGGGGGGCGVVIIPVVVGFTSYLCSIGQGGHGGTYGGNTTGGTGGVGADTTFFYNGILYTAYGGSGGAGGGGGGSGYGAGGAGGSGGNALSCTVSYTGNTGNNGNAKVPPNTLPVFGGSGGLNGNFTSNTTPPVAYNVIDNSIISQLLCADITYNYYYGNNNNQTKPLSNQTLYYGQGGQGGYSDDNYGGDFGSAGFIGGQGAIFLFQYFGTQL